MNSKRIQRASLLAGWIVLLLALGFVYSRNSLFRLSDIAVECEDPEVRDWVTRQLVGNLGRPLFSVPFKEIEKNLLKLPRIERVTLFRRWPSRMLLQVEVRKPVAMAFKAGRLWAVDGRGFLIHQVFQPLDRPLLVGFNALESTSPGVQRLEDLPGGVFSWLESLQKKDSGTLDVNDFNEFKFDRDRGLLALSFERNLVMELGSQDFDTAWRNAEKSIQFVRAKGIPIHHLDATYANRVVVKTRPRLQNPEYRLNLEELVRRKEPAPPAAR